MSGAKPVIGTKGVTYGLQLPAKSTSKATRAPAKSNLFSVDDDEGIADVNAQLKLHEMAAQRDKKTSKKLAEALEEDPMAFAYDEVFTDMKREKLKYGDQKTDEGKLQPKYIHQLMHAAKVKEKQDMLILQKKLQRELEEEKELFGEDTKKYVTTAYKRQLEKNAVYEEELNKKEERDRKFSVESKGHTGGFLLNLLETRSRGIDQVDEEMAIQRGRKRSRSPSEDSEEAKEREREAERERVRLLHERAQKDHEQAELLRREREMKKEIKTRELQTQFAQHATTDEEKEEARRRYLERKRQRTQGPAPSTSGEGGAGA